MSDAIRNKLWNIELVVEKVKLFPQTYKTILGALNSDGTCQLILRRKMNKLCKAGDIYKTTIPGTRFGQVIFYYHPKRYNILIEAGRAGSVVYCYFDSVRISKYYFRLRPCWMLSKGRWVGMKEKIIFEGNVLKDI